MKKLLYLTCFIVLLTGCLDISVLTDDIDVRLSEHSDILTEVIPYDDSVKIIGLISKYEGDPFLDLVMDTAEEKLGLQGYQVIRKSPYSYTNTINEQNKILIEYIYSGIDGIILIPNDTIAINQSIALATQQGIPVVIVDTPIDTDDLAVRNPDLELVAYVQINNEQAAYDALNQFLTNDLDTYNAILINGDMNNTNAIQRRDGFKNAITNHSNATLLREYDGGWQEHFSYAHIMDEFEMYSDTNLVVCGNDRMAIGAILALNELNLLDQVTVTGFDGIDDAYDAILNDQLAYTVKQNPPDFGIIAAEIITVLLNDKNIDSYNYIETQTITKELINQ